MVGAGAAEGKDDDPVAMSVVETDSPATVSDESTWLTLVVTSEVEGFDVVEVVGGIDGVVFEAPGLDVRHAHSSTTATPANGTRRNLTKRCHGQRAYRPGGRVSR